MPTFTYEAMNQQGQEVKDELDALSTEDAIAKIKNLGYFPTRIREKGGSRSKANAPAKKKGTRSVGFGRVKTKQVTQLTRQLSTLQDAGLPILRSLNILHEQQKPGVLKNILKGMGEEIEGGSTLSEACGKFPKAFNRLYVNMVAAGETGGVLDVILQRLAEFMEKAEKLKRKIIGAMIYPAVVVTFALGIVTGIMIVVIPKFKDIFMDFGVKLPGVTMILLNTSDWVVKGKPLPGWAMILLSPFVAYILWKLIRSSDGGRYVVDVVMLKIPVFGNLVEKAAVSRFARTLGTLISAGVPILEAINITKETSGNEVYARAMQKVHDAIREGESFATPLRATGICDGLVVNMVDVGEETGELDKMLLKVANNYEEEMDVAVASLVSLLEPIMVVLLGGMVGFIVVALFMPLVQLIQNVSG
ncbi:MAG: type II secretion system F family protein [Planctomycetes bacterium]|nr:type II secretion system F family protein [Planctomycetota bacterium]MBI3833895.1 type II secretion system F family protein [Planctomycetota bacterium]